MSLSLKFANGIRRLGLLTSLRSSATAAASGTKIEKKTPVASDELRLTFASPTKAFFTDSVVKQVDVPTMAGTVGLLAKHVPLLGVLKPGVVTVTDLEGNITKKFVSSGSIAMNPDGSCQVLAEEAIEIDDIDETAVRQLIEALNLEYQRATSDIEKAEVNIKQEVCEALLNAVANK
uniref:F-ATPase delta subunit n=1 Tax=Syphacia muris TaxID=451379 RepID=A0A0N5B160_9BILA